MEHRIVRSEIINGVQCFNPDDVILMLTRIISVVQEHRIKYIEENGEDIKIGVILPDLNQNHPDAKIQFVWERIKDEN